MNLEDALKRIKFLEEKLQTQSNFLQSNTRLVNKLREENRQLRAKLNGNGKEDNDQSKVEEA